MADSVNPDPPPTPPPPDEVAVTQPIIAIPPKAPPPRQGCMEKRSPLEKVLIVLVIIILILCLGFLAAFLVFYFFAMPPEGTCLTEDCVNAAARLKRYMDVSVLPCENFYEYACGGWIKSQVLAPHQRKLGVESIIGDANTLKFKDILQRPSVENEPLYKSQPKVFYSSCLNQDAINKRGKEPFLNLLETIGKFPTLDSSWNETEFKLEPLLVKMSKLLINPLFLVDVIRDLKTKEVNRIYMSDPQLGLGASTNYRSGRDDPRVRNYEIWLVENLVLLGAERSTAENNTREVVDFEIKMAQLMRDPRLKGEISSRYNPMTIALLQSRYPWLNWLEYFQGLAQDPISGGIFIGVEEIVINLEPAFLEKLGTLLANTDKRVLVNYIMFRLLPLTSWLSSDFVALTDNFNKVTQGVDPRPRWERCAYDTIALFPESVSRMYIDEFFSKEAKTYLNDMISDLTASLAQILEENSWMKEETKKKAETKLKALKSKVGYPEYILDDDRLNSLHKIIPTKEDEYFESYLASSRYVAKERVKQLRQPIDENKWSVSAVTVNAQYDVLENQINFPAAFLQEPVFSPRYPSSMNYGAIGMVIGHEITHGFDTNGHRYDEKGVLVDWWSEQDKKGFQARTQCFVDQYGCYKWDGYSIDGEKTLGENIADNGGLKQSYRAYRNLIKRRGSEEPRLPGLKLTHDQVFFLSFAQVWCSKYRDEVKKDIVETEDHTPSPLRVYGTLQNSQEFADAFKCSAESRMNPMKKCTLW